MAERVIAIRAGRLVDVEGGEVRPERTIVVRGDRIDGVLTEGQESPANAEEIDLSSATVAPGLIDLHAHLIGSVDEGHGYAVLLQRSGAQEALVGVRNARATLLAGFTTVRDARSSTSRFARRSTPDTSPARAWSARGRT